MTRIRLKPIKIKVRSNVRPCPNGVTVRTTVSNGSTTKTVTRHIHR